VIRLPVFGGSRIAPGRFELGALDATPLRRGLVWAVVPVVGGETPSGTFVRCGRELVSGTNNNLAGGVTLRGEASGPALWSVNAGMNFDNSPLPTAVPFSCFSFLVNRGTTALQSLVGLTTTGTSSWTFQLSYGSGQLGLTRWGIADNPTVALGAVPTGGAASCVGMSLDGTTARFFLNGRFENVASGAVNVPTGTIGNSAFHTLLGSAIVDAGVHVLYVWNRVVTDAEFLQLMQDPWALVRPVELPFALVGGGGGGGGSGARVFVPAFIG
jgi:hypothetical protein